MRAGSGSTPGHILSRHSCAVSTTPPIVGEPHSQSHHIEAPFLRRFSKCRVQLRRSGGPMPSGAPSWSGPGSPPRRNSRRLVAKELPAN